MIHLANILIADGHATHAQRLLERLQRSGYTGRLTHSGASALALAGQERPDIVLIGPELPDGDELEFATRLKSGFQDLPVVVITNQPLGQISRRALDAGVDDVIAAPFQDEVLLARMRPLVRLGTMRTELLHRSATAARFGVKAEGLVEPRSDNGYSLLAVGKDAATVAALFGDAAEFTITDNVYDAEDLLTRRNFDAAIVRIEDEPEACLGLCAQVRNNPRLFNLPILVIDGGEINPVEAYRRGASHVVAKTAEPDILYGAVLSLVRRQQRRWTIRNLLQQTLQQATRDPDTGVYSREFLLAYLARRLAETAQEHRHLSIIVFRIPNVEGVRQHFGNDAAEHLLLQLGQWITGLLRAEDLTARFQGNEFCVVLPDTPHEEAEVVMHRIAGVLTYTDFAVREVYQPIKVWVQVGSTLANPGDDSKTVIGRARLGLD